MEHFLYEAEKVTGPFTTEQVRSRLAANEISSDTLIQPVDGTSNWVPLSTYLLLASPAPPELGKAPVDPVSSTSAAVSFESVREMCVSTGRKVLAATIAGTLELAARCKTILFHTDKALGEVLLKASPKTQKMTVYGTAILFVFLSIVFFCNYSAATNKIADLETQIKELKNGWTPRSPQVNPNSPNSASRQNVASDITTNEEFQSSPAWLKITIHRAMLGSACVEANKYYDVKLRDADRSDKQLVYFEVSVKNLSGERLLETYQDFTIEDSNGVSYPSELPNDALHVQVEPSKSGRGGIGFVVPKTFVPSALIYNPENRGAFITHKVFCRCGILSISKRLGFILHEQTNSSVRYNEEPETSDLNFKDAKREERLRSKVGIGTSKEQIEKVFEHRLIWKQGAAIDGSLENNVGGMGNNAEVLIGLCGPINDVRYAQLITLLQGGKNDDELVRKTIPTFARVTAGPQAETWVNNQFLSFCGLPYQQRHRKQFGAVIVDTMGTPTGDARLPWMFFVEVVKAID